MKNRESLNRREFLARVKRITAATAAIGALGLPSLADPISASASQESSGCEIGRLKGKERASAAFNVRLDAALYERNLPLADHACNSSEQSYPSMIANYSKCLPHNDLGEVDLDAYNALIHALETGDPRDFEAIPMGGVVRLTNPQAALAFDLQGPDSHQLTVPPAPAFNSAQQASEMAELYWQALARDVPFSEYASHPIPYQAAVDLTRFSDFRGPKVDSQVTTNLLFRGNTSGDLAGPYLSQFLSMDIPYGALPVKHQIQAPRPGTNHMIRYDECMAIQSGQRALARSGEFDPTLRYIRNGRDLGEFVHRDFPYQCTLNAAMILLGMEAPSDQGNPYLESRTQMGFTTFGVPHLVHMVALVGDLALKAAWYQKWLVHRRLRPEEFSARVHNHMTGRAQYPIHPDLTAVTPVLNLTFESNRSQAGAGTYLLSQAYPEGCPTHPAYPAGHATFAGAGITILKAFFDESYVIPNPGIASSDGLTLLPYTGGPELTVGGELNKLAMNIAMGRNFAGIHWRTDASESLKLGEAVAIGVLTEMKLTLNEAFKGFTLTKLDGTTITI